MRCPSEKAIFKIYKRKRKALQIETAIWEKEDGEREVTKRPLSAASRGHVAKMYENFRWFEESGFLLPCRWKDDTAYISFYYREKLLQFSDGSNQSKRQGGFS